MKAKFFLIAMLMLVGGLAQAEVDLDNGFVTACEARGGQCVALYPGSCRGTVTGDSCGGGLGVQCCFQRPTLTPCEQRGGECVALVPGACRGGHTTGDSCGGGLGATCCFR